MTRGAFYDRLIAAASQGAEGTAILLRHATEADEPYGTYNGEEPIEKLCDAAKLAIEAGGEDALKDPELNQVYGALQRFLEGWMG
ncbi:MAG TPA: hypothetical protein VF605_11820 [Allosphingosinicella sp.]|jgi:hypothetical protein